MKAVEGLILQKEPRWRLSVLFCLSADPYARKSVPTENFYFCSLDPGMMSSLDIKFQHDILPRASCEASELCNNGLTCWSIQCDHNTLDYKAFGK